MHTCIHIRCTYDITIGKIAAGIATSRLKIFVTMLRVYSARGIHRWGSICSNWVRHCYIYYNLWHPVIARYLSCVVPEYRPRIRVAPGESEEEEDD